MLGVGVHACACARAASGRECARSHAPARTRVFYINSNVTFVK